MTPTSSRTLLCRALLVALGIALGLNNAHADDRTWNNAAGGNFNVAGNWTPNFVPNLTDTAIFSTAGPYTVAFSQNHQSSLLRINATDISFDLMDHAYTVPSMVIGETAHGSLTIDSTATLGILSGSNLQLGTAGQVEFAPGFNGTITVESNARLELDGTLTLGEESVGDPGHGTLVLNGGTVEVADLSMSLSSGTITYNSGDLTITGSGFFDTGAAIAVNNGTLSAAFASFSQGVTANSGGTVELENSNVNGNITANTSGTVNLSNGAHSVSGSITLAGGTVTLESGSLNTQSVTGGTLGWTSGTIFYNSDLTVGAVGPLGSSITLSDKSLQLTGASGALTVTGTLVVNKTTHGTLSAKSIANSGGTFEFNKGSLTVSDADLTIGGGNLTALGGGTTVTLNSGDSLTVGNFASTDHTMIIDDDYTLTLNGGSLTTDLFTASGPSGRVRYASGSVLVKMQPLVIDANSGSGHIDGPIGTNTELFLGPFDSISTDDSVTISSTHSVDVTGGGNLQAGTTLDVDGELIVGTDGMASAFGAATVTGELTISGGSFSSNSLTNSSGTVSFHGGSLSVMTGNLVIGDTGVNNPDPVIVGVGSSILSSAGTIVIDAGRTLSIQGGSLQTNSLTSAGTLDFHSGHFSIFNDNLEIGPAGIDGPDPTIVGSGSVIVVAPSEFSGGGDISVVADREVQLSGGFVHSKTLDVDGKARFNSGILRLTGIGEELAIVANSPGSGGISHPSGTVTIGSTSEISVIDGTVRIEAGTLHLNGGLLRTRSIQEDVIDSFQYSGGTLYLSESDLVIEAGASANDLRLLGASPLLASGDDVRIEDFSDDFITPPMLGNTTIKAGSSLRIHGGDFLTSGDLTIEQGATLSGEDRNIPFVKEGLGGTPELSESFPATVMTNNGVVSPGYAGFEIGSLEYDGDYVQGATGELHLELDVFQDGELRFTSSDQLRIGGKATLDGSLVLSFAFGYDWHAGDTFNLLVAQFGINGTFDPLNISYPELPPGYSLQFDYDANFGDTLRLTVIPEPGAFLLAVIAMIGVLRSRRSQSADINLGTRFSCPRT